MRRLHAGVPGGSAAATIACTGARSKLRRPGRTGSARLHRMWVLRLCVPQPHSPGFALPRGQAMKSFTARTAPHRHSGNSVLRVMLIVLLALLPAGVVYWHFFGWALPI